MKRIPRVLLAIAPALCLSLLVTDRASAAPDTTSGSTAPTGWTGTYLVAPGDNLFFIARKVEVKVTDLLAANELTLASTIHPGDTLVVPAPPAPPAPVVTTYTVVGGDHLIRIASRHGVTLTALLQANELTATSVILPGRTLTIPPATLPIPATPTPTPTPAPAPAPAPAAAPPGTAPRTYTVVAGDYLSRIAARHGVTLGALVKANKIEITTTIVPGNVLSVPPATLPIPVAVASFATPATSGHAGATDAVSAGKVETLITFLKAQVGKPYKFFTAGPDTFDCSGLVVAGYSLIDITLPHQSGLQSTKGAVVDWHAEPLKAGDLVFMASSSKPDVIGHVGIALDDSTWIQAPGTNKTVRIGSLPGDDKIVAVRRIVQP